MITRVQKNQNSLNLFLNNYFNILILLVVIIVLTLSYFFVIRPKYDETMAAIQTNIEKQQKLYSEQQKKLNSLVTISNLYSKISSSDLKKFNGVLPDDYVKEKLFGELDEIISQNGFILNSVEITKTDKKTDAKKEAATDAKETVPEIKTNVSSLTIEMSLSAVNYSGFKNLLKVLETNLRLFDITQVAFAPGGNSATISLTTYYYNKNK